MSSTAPAGVANPHEWGSTGLPHRKVLMWAFLGSDCMFFGSLIATYLAYKGKSLAGPYPHQILNIPVTSTSTFVLLCSSFLMVLALAAIQHNDLKKFRTWCFGTAFFGLIFLGFQVFEFTEFYHHGLSLSRNLFGSTFFVLTGTHGCHVAVGVIWLLSLFAYSFTGKLDSSRSLDVEIAGLYWHFVDIVWIVIFTVVYLVEFVS
ncbi:MAG TPA: cytochrome c oxidase subunit 3 [Candidatus Nitrosotenuis sp.]|jgi:heme/copper-type cytochrome/quinol oxidase subunit 3|nr:cytochrome c oxidase subunit 3 [Candidatus Nitrosotenuis sp.]